MVVTPRFRHCFHHRCQWYLPKRPRGTLTLLGSLFPSHPKVAPSHPGSLWAPSGIPLGLIWAPKASPKCVQAGPNFRPIGDVLAYITLFRAFPHFFRFSKCVCKTEKTCMYVLIATDIWGPIDFPLSFPERKKVPQSSQNMPYPSVSPVRAL